MTSQTLAEDRGKTRDAERSREAILSAAEELFAEHGFDGVSLGQIAAAADLSRGTPSYFFGSKEQLYQAVLARVFRDREEATRLACQPLVAWAADANGHTAIQRALTEAVDGYLGFLQQRPSFLKLLQREELAGAVHLEEAPRQAQAIEDAFAAVRAVAGKRGLASFDVEDAVLLFVALTFYPLVQSTTMAVSVGRDFSSPRARRRHARFVVEQLLHLIGPDGQA